MGLFERVPLRTERNIKVKLAVCIPNYNRLDCLEKLIKETAEQIVRHAYQAEIEICVSDDCSLVDPNDMIERMRGIYPDVKICYERNERNRGMDYNFLNCVKMTHSEYAWIIGNDDLPTEQSLQILLKTLGANEDGGLDIIITPFDCFDYDGRLQEQNQPFGSHITGRYTFDTSDRKQFHQLIMSVDRNGALFDFLSNIVFKRERWIEHGDMFEDRMNSIFIQIYMNMQTLIEGAKVLYLPEKIIKNFLDYETNETIDRQYKVFVGLYDVYQYFLEGEELEAIKRQVVDRFVQSELFELDETEDPGRRLRNCQTEKIDILKKYYRPKIVRKEYFIDKFVIIYGAGELGKRALNELKNYGAYIVGFCDRDKEKAGTTVCDVPVFNVERLLEYSKDDNEIEVVVANFYSLVSIVKMLEQKGIWKISIIT